MDAPPYSSRKRNGVTSHTHQTAPTRFVEVERIRFAYRRFGKTGRRAAYRSFSTSTSQLPWIIGNVGGSDRPALRLSSKCGIVIFLV
jgi:hypothetical protein